MSNLKERAARAMGWTLETFGADNNALRDEYYCKDGEFVRNKNWSPEHDRNAAHELLMEVGRRGLLEQLQVKLENLDTDQEFPTLASWNYFLLVAPLDLIVTAACEVLEEN